MNLNSFTTKDAQDEIKKFKESLKEERIILIQSSPEFLASFEEACVDLADNLNKNKNT